MVKAFVGKKAYYIYAKQDTKKMKNGIDDAVKQVAQVTHLPVSVFDVQDAKLIGKTADGREQYEIGTVGKHFAITRR